MKKLFIILFLGLCTFVSAQNMEDIQGTVLDKKTGEAVIGANVVVVGTTTGTVTDIDGHFKIRMPLNSELRISYIEYQTQIQKITDRKPITVYMEENRTELDEVVVIGYGVQRKSDVTGAISSLSAKDITSSPVASAVQAIQGKATGVQVIQNTGSPGGKTTIKIRGTGTINDSDPLYIVDGFVVDAIDHINPNDIANMEVLKDAASASIYGARGANGVVLITTKQGESGKAKITFDAFVGVSSPWKTIDVMNIDQFALMRDYVEGRTNYSAEGQLYYSKDINGNLYYDTGKFQRLDSIKSSSSTPANWWDAVTQTGVKQQYNLSVGGGNENHQYLVSGNLFDESGIVKTSGYRRVSTRLNLSNKITRWLSLRTNVLYTNEARDVVPEGQDGVLKRSLHQNPIIHTYNNAGYFSENHPIAVLARNHNRQKTDRIDLNLDLSAQINQHLTYQFKFSNYTGFDNQYRFNEVEKLEENFQMPTDLTKVIRNSVQTNKMEINNLLTFVYNRNKHDLNMVVGSTVETFDTQNVNAERQGSPANTSNLWYLSSAYFGDRATGSLSEWSAVGFLGRLNYAFDNKYLLQVNFRSDASSKFAPSERWGFFPSASAGWKFTGEEWMRNLEFLSFGKLRLGWGRLGNNRIGEYARYTVIDNEYNYSYGTGAHVTQSGATATTLGNEYIRWEKTESYNIGLDMNFFNNRLNTTVEYFDKETSDMLLRVPVPVSVGTTSAPMVNAGSVQNRGIEWLINYKGTVEKFKYEIGFNLSYIKNKVTNLGSGNEPVWGARLTEESIGDYVTKTEAGMPIAYFYGYVTDGIFQTSEEVAASAQNDGLTFPGDFRFKDLNNDGKIDASDRTYLGSPHPDYVFGIPINMSYGNWELSMFFQGQYGNKIFNVMDY
ncbi:MAG: TonB-dependent receptor, partial [Candidatus Symbiothrix sp.]|nr:TonB-dependent receptor [Candidatus Symbiothrix sp.]